MGQTGLTLGWLHISAGVVGVNKTARQLLVYNRCPALVQNPICNMHLIFFKSSNFILALFIWETD